MFRFLKLAFDRMVVNYILLLSLFCLTILQHWDTPRIAKAWVPMSWRQWILNLPTNYRKVGMRINILWFVWIRLQRMISKLTVMQGRITGDRFLWWGSKLCFYIKLCRCFVFRYISYWKKIYCINLQIANGPLVPRVIGCPGTMVFDAESSICVDA